MCWKGVHIFSYLMVLNKNLTFMSALRCLVFAFADVPSDFATYDGSEVHPAHQQLLNPSNYSSIESNLTFVGFVGLRRCVKPLQTDVTQIEHRSARIMDTVQGGVLVNQLDQTEVFMSDHASLAACDSPSDQSVHADHNFPLDCADQTVRTVPSDHPDRTARAVHCIDPQTPVMELSLEPRFRDGIDRPTSLLIQPFQHSKTDRKVRIHLEREESKDVHRFSLMALLVRPTCPEGCTEVLASVSSPMMDFCLSYFTKALILELSKDLFHNSTQLGSADHPIVQSVRVNHPTGRVDHPDHVLILTPNVEQDMHVLKMNTIVAYLDKILVCNVYFDVHLDKLKCVLLVLGKEILIFDLNKYLSCTFDPGLLEFVLSIQERQVQPLRNESIDRAQQHEIWKSFVVQPGYLGDASDRDSVQNGYLNIHKVFCHESNFPRKPTHQELTEAWNHLKSFTEEGVINFPNRRFSSPSIREYQTSKGDSGPRKKLPESMNQRCFLSQPPVQTKSTLDQTEVFMSDHASPTARVIPSDHSVHADFPLDRADQTVRTDPSDHPVRTARAVHRIDPRTSVLELSLEPRPRDGFDRPTSLLSQTIQHSKTDSQARFNLER
ncbi:hypothetical protein F2Q68_00038464 [Brassica cretica]|uniref:Uncharacterized protein n=1 Tax=Brassica cretica TaxID=69181 RepID=A0A8S9MB90_BRACR|nr:hypothetical protein F2Q68_00038464 [Brassica cretica]